MIFISRVKEILYSYIYPSLEDAVEYSKSVMVRHFSLSSLKRLGIKYLPELLGEKKEEDIKL